MSIALTTHARFRTVLTLGSLLVPGSTGPIHVLGVREWARRIERTDTSPFRRRNSSKQRNRRTGVVPLCDLDGDLGCRQPLKRHVGGRPQPRAGALVWRGQG